MRPLSHLTAAADLPGGQMGLHEFSTPCAQSCADLVIVIQFV